MRLSYIICETHSSYWLLVSCFFFSYSVCKATSATAEKKKHIHEQYAYTHMLNSFLSAVRLLFSDQFSSLKTDIDGYERKRIKIYLRGGNETLILFFSSFFSLILLSSSSSLSLVLLLLLYYCVLSLVDCVVVVVSFIYV